MSCSEYDKYYKTRGDGRCDVGYQSKTIFTFESELKSKLVYCCVPDSMRLYLII